MNLAAIVVLAVLVAAPPPVADTPRALAPAASPSIDSLSWLAGHFVTEGPEGSGSEELWLPAKAGLMTGMNRSVSRKGHASFEFLRIEQRPDGVVYVAQPGGGAPTEFRLTRSEGTLAVFENPAHDFPKRLAYRRVGDALTARVDDGAEGGEGFELRWTLCRD